jgi:LacI family transcriptional regulator
MQPTIYTIAEQAGVSIATVSRALNNGPRISEATRARILKIATDLGYQPSAAARGLALKTTETLALIFPQVSGPYFSELIGGAEGVARQQNYHLLVYSLQTNKPNDPFLHLLPARTDGLILSNQHIGEEYIHHLHQRSFPFVLMGREVAGLKLDTVRPDNEGGAYQLTRHLIEVHGCQRIAFVCGSEDNLHTQERLAGYNRALQASGLPAWVEPSIRGDFSEAGGYARMQRILTWAEQPQAVFAASDQMAVGVLAAITQAGLHVPEDIAVVGFDDIPSAAYLQPALTTVNQAIFEQGALATEHLLQRINWPDMAPRSVVWPTRLIIRRSCGCGNP